MTRPRSQPTTTALGLSLLVIAEIGLFQFAGTHQIGWLVMILPFVLVSPNQQWPRITERSPISGG